VYDLPHIPRAAVFVVVIQQGSFSAAARELKLSKSVVSTHIQALESALGVRLLERTSRSLHLSEAGRQFFPYAERMLQAWTLGRERLHTHADEPRGLLRVSTSSILCEKYVMPVIARYIADYPHTQVSLHISDRTVNILDEKIDVAIRGGSLPDSSLIARKLGVDHEIIVGGPALVTQWSEICDPKDLCDAPWVVHTSLKQPSRWSFHCTDGRQSKLSVQPRVWVSSAMGLRDLACQGVGFAVMPSFMAEDARHKGHLQHILPTWSAQSSPLHAIYTSRANTPQKTLRFVAMLQEVFPRGAPSTSLP